MLHGFPFCQTLFSPFQVPDQPSRHQCRCACANHCDHALFETGRIRSRVEEEWPPSIDRVVPHIHRSKHNSTLLIIICAYLVCPSKCGSLSGIRGSCEIVCEEFQPRWTSPHKDTDRGDRAAEAHVHEYGPSCPRVICPGSADECGCNPKSCDSTRIIIDLFDCVTTHGRQPLAHQIVGAETFSLP